MALPVLTSAQSSAWDRLAVDGGSTVAALMESAGRGIVAVLAARFAPGVRQGVLVACGPGNNGGDGWVIARALQALEVPVWAIPLPGSPSPLNATMRALAQKAGVRELAPDGPWPEAALVVDAILGTGAKGAPRPAAQALIARLADLQLPVVAVDGPSGLDLNDGVSHGGLQAAVTISFNGCRRGHLLARDEIGDLILIDIGLPPAPREWPRLFRAADAARLVQPFGAASHKGTRGRVVIVGGDRGMTGAARIAARAAFGAGAGLVHVVAPAESVAVLAGAEPDVQTHVQGFEDAVDPGTLALVGRADAVVIGPGLGRHPGRRELVLQLLGASRTPVVLDADALIAFQGAVDQLALAVAERSVVLTPHAGEYRTLFPESAAGLGTDPWQAALDAARRSGAVVLVKGVPTVVARGDGALETVAAGNPGLATGGSGDLLSGLIGALLAQGHDPVRAAATGAQVLGDAADLAARRTTARSMRPMDVVAALPDVWRRYDLLRRAPAVPTAPILYELPLPAPPNAVRWEPRQDSTRRSVPAASST